MHKFLHALPGCIPPVPFVSRGAVFLEIGDVSGQPVQAQRSFYLRGGVRFHRLTFLLCVAANQLQTASGTGGHRVAVISPLPHRLLSSQNEQTDFTPFSPQKSREFFLSTSRLGLLSPRFLDLGPRILKRDRAIEDKPARGGIWIDTEVPLPLELVTVAVRSVRKTGFNPARGQAL